jgi:hypothetical protein
MIKQILELLDTNDFRNKSELIDIAKGKYKIPLTIREGWKQRKRRK